MLKFSLLFNSRYCNRTNPTRRRLSLGHPEEALKFIVNISQIYSIIYIKILTIHYGTMIHKTCWFISIGKEFKHIKLILFCLISKLRMCIDRNRKKLVAFLYKKPFRGLFFFCTKTHIVCRILPLKIRRIYCVNSFKDYWT